MAEAERSGRISVSLVFYYGSPITWGDLEETERKALDEILAQKIPREEVELRVAVIDGDRILAVRFAGDDYYVECLLENGSPVYVFDD